MSQILIVDDERVIRDGLQALLAGEGYSVRAVRDGDAALAAIAETVASGDLTVEVVPATDWLRRKEK